jgi:N-acetylglucosamine-6-phosphate deacetylase
VTLAPEIENCLELIRYLREKDICVSAGHTCASAEEFAEAVRAGVTLCTHLFNGMNPLHHRDPGIIAGAFLNDDIYTEFIPDLIHIDKDVLKLIVKIKGEDRCILITDALSATCLGDGIFDLGSQRVTVRDGIARTDSGSLAGSIIMLNRAVKNMVLKVGVDLKAVLKMVTVNPAKVIGVDGFKGMIREGYDADLNLLDENLDVVMSTVMGEVVQKAD